MTLSDSTKKLLTRTMKRACQTRWLSFNNVVQSLHQEIVAVVQTLNMFSGEATSYGLMKKISTLEFIGTLYILQRVLPILSDMSKLFQKGNVNFSMICPGLERTKHRLRSLSKEEFFDSLRKDLSPDGRLGTLEITVNEFIMNHLMVTMSKYVDAVCRNSVAIF